MANFGPYSHQLVPILDKDGEVSASSSACSLCGGIYLTEYSGACTGIENLHPFYLRYKESGRLASPSNQPAFKVTPLF